MTEPPAEAQSAVAYPVFDLVRALAATAVVACHVRSLFLTDFTGGASPLVSGLYFATGLGDEAVTVFFVVSGFWIGRSCLRRLAADDWSWKTFLFERLTRLMIVLAPALVLGGVFDIIGRYGLMSPVHLGRQGNVILHYDVATHLTLGGFLANAVFLQTLAAPTFGSNGPLWSLCNEFWYYLWFAAIASAVASRRHALVARWAWAAAAVATAILFHGLLPRLGLWLTGVALFVASERLTELSRRQIVLARLAVAPAGLAFCAALALSRIQTAMAARQTALEYAVALAFAALMLCLLAGRLRLTDKLHAIADFGARSSYSLYLFHMPAAALLAALVVPTTRMHPSATGLAVFLAAMLAIIAGGLGFSHVTERRTPALRRRLATAAGVGAPG